ncbi:hypothetical protein [Planococcus rifietoensis]|uniref:hypothetical protein n=1 Tax=Planococcus rifietoensis TaxID=200991 RepID=UPI003850215B
MGWKIQPGNKIAVTAEVLKVKNETPTLLLIDGVCYRKDVSATEKEKNRHNLTTEQRRHRLQQMGRLPKGK